MKANAATMSRRRMLTTMPAAAAATDTGRQPFPDLQEIPGKASPDPVFAAIEKRRLAIQAWYLQGGRR